VNAIESKPNEMRKPPFTQKVDDSAIDGPADDDGNSQAESDSNNIYNVIV